MKLKWKENDITKYVTSVTWSGSARQAARTVAFSVAYSPNDKSVETLDIKLGDKIVFYPDTQTIPISLEDGKSTAPRRQSQICGEIMGSQCQFS